MPSAKGNRPGEKNGNNIFVLPVSNAFPAGCSFEFSKVTNLSSTCSLHNLCRSFDF